MGPVVEQRQEGGGRRAGGKGGEQSRQRRRRRRAPDDEASVMACARSTIRCAERTASARRGLRGAGEAAQRATNLRDERTAGGRGEL